METLIPASCSLGRRPAGEPHLSKDGVGRTGVPLLEGHVDIYTSVLGSMGDFVTFQSFHLYNQSFINSIELVDIFLLTLGCKPALLFFGCS